MMFLFTSQEKSGVIIPTRISSKRDHIMFSDTPAVVLSSLAHPLIPGLNFLKLTKSKTEFKTNNIEIGSKIYPAEVHCITSSNSTIIIATSDVY